MGEEGRQGPGAQDRSFLHSQENSAGRRLFEREWQVMWCLIGSGDSIKDIDSSSASSVWTGPLERRRLFADQDRLASGFSAGAILNSTFQSGPVCFSFESAPAAVIIREP